MESTFLELDVWAYSSFCSFWHHMIQMNCLRVNLLIVLRAVYAIVQLSPGKTALLCLETVLIAGGPSVTI